MGTVTQASIATATKMAAINVPRIVVIASLLSPVSSGERA